MNLEKAKVGQIPTKSKEKMREMNREKMQKIIQNQSLFESQELDLKAS